MAKHEIITKFDIGDNVYYVQDSYSMGMGKINGMTFYKYEDGSEEIFYGIDSYYLHLNEEDIFSTKRELKDYLQDKIDRI